MRVTAVRVHTEESRGRYAEVLGHISSGKLDRLQRFRHNKDFNLGLMAELLIRTMIGEELGLANSALRIVPDNNGKPQLEGIADFHFNVAHSGEWVACITDRQPVGIDVEQIKEVEPGIARRFFTEQEAADLDRLTGVERTRAFYRLWTLKESYMKADGRGMRLGLDTFSFSIDDSVGSPGIKLNTELLLQHCSFRLYDCCPGYELAVCAMHDSFPDEASVWDEEELLRRFESIRSPYNFLQAGKRRGHP
ncbi:4'-phosphopantetheinyl transferase family protein [Paenibacillus sepulcri]